MVEARYSRNIGAVTEEEFALLRTRRVFLAGCGGLGGNILAHLLRIGLGAVTAVDGDVFEASNLNRQLLSSVPALGRSKVEEAAAYAAAVNPDVAFTGHAVFLDESNAASLIRGHDLVIDALDNIASRRVLAAACREAGIPLIYGAIRGWTAQVSVLMPETAPRALDLLYPKTARLTDKSCLSFTPALCASLEAAEAVKLLLGKPSELDGQLLFVDLLSNEQELIPLV